MIISPDLVICTIQISAKVVQLSSMFLSATLSMSIIFQALVSAGAAAAAREALKPFVRIYVPSTECHPLVVLEWYI